MDNSIKPPDDNPMSVTIGSLTFDNASYDARGYVLYLHTDGPQAAADSEATPEGHVLRASTITAKS